MMLNTRELERQAALNVAAQMMAAIRTAPKSCGIDDIEAIAIDGDDIKKLAAEMRKITDDGGDDYYKRDADFVERSECVILVAVHNNVLGGKVCGLCGYDNCGANRKAGAHCALKHMDMGIALGSAVSIAADNRIDNRILLSAGRAAYQLGIIKADDITGVVGIPLAVAGKNPFYMRPDEIEMLWK